MSRTEMSHAQHNLAVGAITKKSSRKPPPTRLFFRTVAQDGARKSKPMSSSSSENTLASVDPANLNIQYALQIARRTESEHMEPIVEQFLEAELDTLVRKLREAPEEYVMSMDEFALFNFFRHRYEDEDFLRPAIARFWSGHRADDFNSDNPSRNSSRRSSRGRDLVNGRNDSIHDDREHLIFPAGLASEPVSPRHIPTQSQ